MTSLLSCLNSLSLCPASFCTSRPNLPVTQVSWLPTFTFQLPKMKRTSFLGVSSRRSLGLHRTIQLQLQLFYRKLQILFSLNWKECVKAEFFSFLLFICPPSSKINIEGVSGMRVLVHYQVIVIFWNCNFRLFCIFKK